MIEDSKTIRIGRHRTITLAIHWKDERQRRFCLRIFRIELLVAIVILLSAVFAGAWQSWGLYFAFVSVWIAVAECTLLFYIIRAGAHLSQDSPDEPA